MLGGKWMWPDSFIVCTWNLDSPKARVSKNTKAKGEFQPPKNSSTGKSFVWTFKRNWLKGSMSCFLQETKTMFSILQLHILHTEKITSMVKVTSGKVLKVIRVYYTLVTIHRCYLHQMNAICKFECVCCVHRVSWYILNLANYYERKVNFLISMMFSKIVCTVV